MSSAIILNIYYLFAIIAFVWMVWRYRSSAFLLLLLCAGFEGTLTFWIPGLAPQHMRVIYVIWITYLVVKFKAWRVIKGKMQVLLWTFVIFSVYFIWVGFYMNDDTFLMTFSQYSKYYVPFAAMLAFGYYHHRNPAYIVYFNKFFGEFILIQIFSAVLKFIFLPSHMYEGMVGTFGDVKGGGAGTSFPLVTLAWVLVNTNMDIRGWKSWLFVAGLLLIGIATGKRAVVILYPAFFMLFTMFVAKKRYGKGVMVILAMLPFMFYLGLRLIPSLNPEEKVWGSFDPEYALNYAQDYSMGKKSKYGEGDRAEGDGRVGANRLLWKTITDYENYTQKTWTGYGLQRIVVNDYAKYSDRQYYFGINSRGSLTGFAMLFLSIGLIGLILFMVYYWFYFIHAKYWRLRFALYGLVMFDFIFYNWQTIQAPLLSILLIFVMYYSQIQYTPSGKFVGRKPPYLT